MSDGLSTTVFMAEILQGARFDIRGVIWQSVPGGSHYETRFPPNLAQDIYGTPVSGDQLNQTFFCVNEMFLPCQGGIGDRRSFAGARSKHPGGVNVLYGDGSVKFLKDSVNPNIWVSLNSINGGEVISADSY